MCTWLIWSSTAANFSGCDGVSALRLGVLGAGLMGQRIAEAAAGTGRFTVAAVADIDKVRADGLASQFGADSFGGVDELLARSDLDAVYIGLPHHQHLAACLAAAEADLHVLIDKPLCNTLDEAQQILAAASASSRVWMLGFSYRFRSEWRRAQAAIAAGAIGKPYFVSDVVVEAYRSTPGWYWDAASGGGVIQLQSHHCFDRIAWLLGAAAQRVSCAVVRLPAGAEESAQIAVEYAGGVVAGISLSFGLAYESAPRTLFVVQGEDGMIQLDFSRTLRIVTADGVVEENHDGDDWLGRELAEFALAIDGSLTGYPALPEGVAALRGAVAAAQAAQAQTWVGVDG
jgi:predicted dehydrogenase